MTKTSRRLLVVGAATGIGAAAATLLAEEGWQLALVDRDADALAATAARLNVVVTAVADAADVDALSAAVTSCLADLGGLDAAWSNVGVQTSGTVEEASLEDFDHAWAVNVRSHSVTARLALPALRANGGGGRC